MSNDDIAVKLAELRAFVEAKMHYHDQAIQRLYEDKYNPLESKVDRLSDQAIETGMQIKGLLDVAKNHEQRITRQEKLSTKAMAVLGVIVFVMSTLGSWLPKLLGE